MSYSSVQAVETKSAISDSVVDVSDERIFTDGAISIKFGATYVKESFGPFMSPIERSKGCINSSSASDADIAVPFARRAVILRFDFIVEISLATSSV